MSDGKTETKLQNEEKTKAGKAEFIPIREVRKIFGLNDLSTRKLLEQANINTLTTPTGRYLYSKASITKFIRENTNIKDQEPRIIKHKIFYCRVSSEKQKEDLTRQIELARARFPDYELISDIGSGINWTRKGLDRILELAFNRSLETVAIFHKDRLSRFAFDLIKRIIEIGGGKVQVVDEEEHRSSEQELAEDLLSIVHIYACKQMGKRRYTKKKSDSQVDQKQSSASDTESESNSEELA